MRLIVIALALSAGTGQAQPAPPGSMPPPDWDLTPIFASADAAAQDRADVVAALPGLAKWQGKLADPVSIRAALDARSALRARAQRYWIWANLRQSRDGSDEAAGADMTAATALFAQIDTATAYLEPKLVALGDAWLAELTNAATLAPHRKLLTQLRTRAGHVLPAAQEGLVASVQPLLRLPAVVRDTLFNIELPYPSITASGEPRRLTSGSMRRMLADPDRPTRRAAWEAFATTQEGFKLTQAALLASYLSGVAWEARPGAGPARPIW